MLTIDGSLGEGGGQILRSALSLSLVTGKPFRIEKIRAARQRPGLMRQHLTALRAAQTIGMARVEDAEVGSRQLTFVPGGIAPGEYRFAVGTAGSAILVLQAVLPALLVANAPSTLILEGGTHNMQAPPYDFLELAFMPVVNRMGPRVEVELLRHGFYPAGGGRISVSVEPAGKLMPFELVERGAIQAGSVRALVANLPAHIGEREVRAVTEGLDWRQEQGIVRDVPSDGPGNAVVVEIRSEHITEVFTGFGIKGVRAELVAEGVMGDVRRYLDADVPVGPHLADQLVLLLALAGGGRYRTMLPTAHTLTNMAVVMRFLEVDIDSHMLDDDRCEVLIRQ
jgi:RNA 3'-terminal phosphate cyclase (ATP)